MVWTGKKNALGYGSFVYQGKIYRTHRLAYELAYGPILGGLCVLHKCDNPPCCNPDHLFLGTVADNNKDKIAKGRQTRGSAHAASKLTEDGVARIRELYKTGLGYKRLGKMFGVTPEMIKHIIKGRNWRHVP